ncbi:hypothetical protein NDU88_003197 [Pleurodeles waltl]|uniref:Uncharacterized protein n=1 Tax=Pleurodeles waltl TaxID=8319 RepID=A0AAV7LEM9_PLEWA|nr:hypothetical protein NDU88_003197 [Pleurodeles waltl]
MGRRSRGRRSRERRSREKRRTKERRSGKKEREAKRTPRREPQIGGSGVQERDFTATGGIRTRRTVKETGTTQRPGRQSAAARHASGEAWQTPVCEAS